MIEKIIWNRLDVDDRIVANKMKTWVLQDADTSFSGYIIMEGINVAAAVLAKQEEVRSQFVKNGASYFLINEPVHLIMRTLYERLVKTATEASHDISSSCRRNGGIETDIAVMDRSPK